MREQRQRVERRRLVAGRGTQRDSVDGRRGEGLNGWGEMRSGTWRTPRPGCAVTALWTQLWVVWHTWHGVVLEDGTWMVSYGAGQRGQKRPSGAWS